MLSPKMGLTNGKGGFSTAEKAVNEMKTLVAAVRTSNRRELMSLLVFMCGNAFGSSKNQEATVRSIDTFRPCAVSPLASPSRNAIE
jgi:hypothetical protein